MWGVGFNNGAARTSPVIEDREEAFGFVLRRAELHFNSDCGDCFGWKLMIDPSKDLFEESGRPNVDLRILQDLYIYAYLNDWFEVRVGQFRIPTSYEGLKSAARIWFPERSWVGWRFGNIRETGIAFSGDLYGADWIVGFFNGRGTNKPLKEGMNEVTARIWIPVLTSTYVGVWFDYVAAHDIPIAEVPRRQSQGIDFVHRYGCFHLQGEFAVGTAPEDEWGAYLLAGWEWTSCNQFAVRSEYFKGHRNPENREWAVDFCYNHFLCLDCGAEMKLQLSPRYGQEKSTGEKEDILSIIFATQVHF